MRRGRKNCDRGVWYAARVCILAHEGGLWVAGKVRCYSTFRLHSEHVQGRGAGSASIPYVESGASTRAEADGQLRQFPTPEPGRAWLWPLWPNGEAGFGSQRVTFGSLPDPSPGAYERRARIRSLSSLHCLLFIARFSSPLFRWLFTRCPALGVQLPGCASS